MRVGIFNQDGVAGQNARTFSGRFTGEVLRPGRYRALLRATDAATNVSTTTTLTFTIVKR